MTAISNQRSAAGRATRATDAFAPRHIGPDDAEVREMLEALGYASLEAFVDATLPEGIRLKKALALPEAAGEHDALAEIRDLSHENEVFRSFLGMGYSDTVVPPVVQRNVLENPGWYTQYTPYQAEIAQGRLEA